MDIQRTVTAVVLQLLMILRPDTDSAAGQLGIGPWGYLWCEYEEQKR
jgi:hypothetical protein